MSSAACGTRAAQWRRSVSSGASSSWDDSVATLLGAGAETLDVHPGIAPAAGLARRRRRADEAAADVGVKRGPAHTEAGRCFRGGEPRHHVETVALVD